jgi:WD40 repeat protein
MRSDFISACAPFPQLSAVLSNHQELIGPMTAAELREAIEQPAFRVGCEVEPALTERLLADVKGQPGALPLLQFALTEVWKKRDVRRLTIGAYMELGKDDKGEPRGIEGVLDHRANEIYRNLRPEDQELCRRLFLRLVQPGEGTEDTKRRVAYRELMPGNAAQAEAVERLVKTLADRDARLVTTEGTSTADSTVEVAHEALIRGWSRLRQWIDADRDGLRIRRQLTEAAREWQKHPGDASYLYQGTRLLVANEWAEIHAEEPNSLEREFLEASIQQEHQRKADEAAALRRLSEALDRAREQAALAEEQTKVADSRRIALLASNMWAAQKLDLALLLAVQAHRRHATAEARNILHRAVFDNPIASFLWGHSDSILSVAVHPNGRILASGSEDMTVALWDMDSCQMVGKPLRGHEHHVTRVAFSKEGDILASCSNNGVILWSTSSHERLGPPLIADEARPTALAFSPEDSKLLACGYDDGTIQLWDCDTFRLRTRVLHGNKKSSFHSSSLCFSPDGRMLASIGSGTIILWDTVSWTSSDSLEGGPNGPNCIAFSPDGALLAAGGEDGSVRLWDVKGKQIRRTLAHHRSPVRTVVFSPDGTSIASGSHDGEVVVADLDGQNGRTVSNGKMAGTVYSIAYSRDGKTLVVGASIPQLLLWILTDQFLKPALKGHKACVNSVHFRPDGKILASGGDDGLVILWDTQDRKQSGPPLAGHAGPVNCVTFSPAGDVLVTGGKDHQVILWDLDSRRPMEFDDRMQDAEIAAVAFTPGGKTLAAGIDLPHGMDSWPIVKFWSVPEKTYLGYVRSVCKMAFSADGRLMATCFWNNVLLWDVESQTRALNTYGLAGHTNIVECVAFSPVDAILASGSGDRSIILWDTTNGKPLGHPLNGHISAVTCLSFSPDGRILASGGFDGTVRLWDVRTRNELGVPLRGHRIDLAHVPLRVTSVAFSPDGKLLASAGADNAVVLWDVDPTSWETVALKIANRTLTSEEMERYGLSTDKEPGTRLD